MNIEHAIILALSEPRSHSKLKIKTRQIRRQNNETLSNDGFDAALKRLRNGKITNRKKINGREVEYSLNSDSSKMAKQAISHIENTGKIIEWLEMCTRIIQRRAKVIDKMRKLSKKSGLGEEMKKDKLQCCDYAISKFVERFNQIYTVYAKINFLLYFKYLGSGIFKKTSIAITKEIFRHHR